MNHRQPRHSVQVVLLCLLALLLATRPAAAQSGSNSLSNSDESLVKALYLDVLVSKRMSELALNDGRSARVRVLGVSIVEALKYSAGDMRRLAAKKNVALEDNITGKQDDVLDNLNNAATDEFDKMYVDALLVYLPKIQGQCESALGQTKDADFQAFLRQAIGMLKEKIEATKAVKQKI